MSAAAMSPAADRRTRTLDWWPVLDVMVSRRPTFVTSTSATVTVVPGLTVPTALLIALAIRFSIPARVAGIAGPWRSTGANGPSLTLNSNRDFGVAGAAGLISPFRVA